MRKVTKSLVTLGLCTTMLAGAFISVPTAGALSGLSKVDTVYAADGEQVELGDLVLRFLAIGEYEPNRYTKRTAISGDQRRLKKDFLSRLIWFSEKAMPRE